MGSCYSTNFVNKYSPINQNTKSNAKNR